MLVTFKKIYKKIQIGLSHIYGFFHGIKMSKSVYIGRGCSIRNGSAVSIGYGSRIEPYCVVIPNKKSATISFGSGCVLGMFSRVTAKKRVSIEDDVITGPNVFISDFNHEYRDVALPIKDQGMMQPSSNNGGVVIGGGSWLGANVVVVGDVAIGKHCVIGANSVVTKDIPGFSVAVGAPAKVIKLFDFQSKRWINFNEKNEH